MQMVSRRNGIKNTDCSAMFSHEKYNFEKRCGELVKFNWIQMSDFGWWATFTLPHFKNFWGGLRYGPKPCEGRTDDHHHLSKTFIFFI